MIEGHLRRQRILKKLSNNKDIFQHAEKGNPLKKGYGPDSVKIYTVAAK